MMNGSDQIHPVRLFIPSEPRRDDKNQVRPFILMGYHAEGRVIVDDEATTLKRGENGEMV